MKNNNQSITLGQNNETTIDINNIENEKIKIIFNLNQDKTEISVNPQTSMKNTINSFIEKKQFQNNHFLVFVFNGNEVKYDDAIKDNRTIDSFIHNGRKEMVILVKYWSKD